jgi:formyl-CoA transferase
VRRRLESTSPGGGRPTRVEPEFDLTGRARRPGGARITGIAPADVLRASDGRDLGIAANQDTPVARPRSVMGCPELAEVPRNATHRASLAHQDELEGVL